MDKSYHSTHVVRPPQAIVTDDGQSTSASIVTQPQTIDPSTLPRTPGLKLFDVLVYPLINYVGVFAISVAATYLTARGNDLKPDGALRYGKIGKMFHTRGEQLKGLFMKTGMSEGAADMSKMVFFSWFDGTLIAPLVKVLEDRREKAAHWLDRKLGTKPENEAVYAAEPKQSWFSIISGRLATAGIIVPTAAYLEKKGLNDFIFSKPGKALAEEIAKKPRFAKIFKGHDLPQLSKTAVFEGFYTMVCTIGLYFSSRLIAKWQGDTLEKKEIKTAEKAPLAQDESPPDISSVTTPKHTLIAHKTSDLFIEKYQKPSDTTLMLARS